MKIIDKELSFNGVSQFAIRNNYYLIPYDEIYGWECMQAVDYNTFMQELKKRKYIWYNSWDNKLKKEYDNFFDYAKRK